MTGKDKDRMDVTMKQTWLCLLQDFRASSGDLAFCAAPEKLIREGIAGFRKYVWPEKLGLPYYELKQQYQLETFLKRYRFADDLYTPTDLTEMTNVKTIRNLERMATPGFAWNSESTFRVLQRARKIIKGILGEYDREEHELACRFGKRANFGTSYARAYLDEKLSGPITSTRSHAVWFNNLITRDPLLGEAITGQSTLVPFYDYTDYLVQVNVPKSFKILRPIKPNTHVGAFYSAGLGEVFIDRLAKVGLDIRFLQAFHGKLAKYSSESRKLVTADLSAASESILWEHVNKLFPRKWLHVLNFGRTRKTQIGRNIYMDPVFSGMGVGYTFPLQTLVFYGIIKAIAELCNKSGRISVYGDDCIYPRSIHKYVQRVFSSIGFNLNMEKTFVESHFRESCGSDFYHGLNCRPCNPQGDSAHCASDSHYLGAIYKIMNGLLLRWDKHEIPTTLYFLKRLAASLSVEGLFLVPTAFADFSGLKTVHPTGVNIDPLFGSCPKWISQKNGNGFWSFKHIAINTRDRTVSRQFPYYWESLRASSNTTIELRCPVKWASLFKLAPPTPLVDYSKMYDQPEDSSTIKWIPVMNRPMRGIGGARLHALRPTVIEKSSTRYNLTCSGEPTWT